MPKKAIVKRQSNEAVLNFIKAHGGDGHAILAPEDLVKMGFDVRFVYPMIFVMKSGKSYKEQIYDHNNQPVDSMEGVDCLSFAYAIANNIGADTSAAQQKMGRGFQAGELCHALHLVAQPIEVAPVKESLEPVG